MEFQRALTSYTCFLKKMWNSPAVFEQIVHRQTQTGQHFRISKVLNVSYNPLKVYYLGNKSNLLIQIELKGRK